MRPSRHATMASDDRNCWPMVSRWVLPGLQKGAFEAAMAMLTRCGGLRCAMVGHDLVEKVPNRAVVAGMLLARASAMVANVAFLAARRTPWTGPFGG